MLLPRIIIKYFYYSQAFGLSDGDGRSLHITLNKNALTNRDSGLMVPNVYKPLLRKF